MELKDRPEYYKIVVAIGVGILTSIENRAYIELTEYGSNSTKTYTVLYRSSAIHVICVIRDILWYTQEEGYSITVNGEPINL